MLDDALSVAANEHALQRTLGVITDADACYPDGQNRFMACLRRNPYTPHVRTWLHQNSD